MDQWPYKSFATCAFCPLNGQLFTDFRHDACAECEIKKIRALLEQLADAQLWEHDHKYQLEHDAELRNCAHCKYALPITNRYRAAGYGEDVWCARDAEYLDEDEEFPTHSAFSTCAQWERAVDASEKEAIES